METKEVIINMRVLAERISSLVGHDKVDLNKLKESIIELAYEVDKIDKED